MKMVSKIVLVFAFCFLHQRVFSGSPKLDSLINVYKTTKVDTVKIRAAIKISRRIRRENPADSSDLRYLYEVYVNSKLANYPKLKILVARTIGDSYYRLNLFESSLRYYKEALSIASTANDENEIVNQLSNLAKVYQSLRKHAEAEQVLLRAVQLSKKSKNVQHLASLYNGLGGQYYELGNFRGSIKYFYESISAFETLRDTTQLVTTLRNISLAYQSMKDFAKAKQIMYRALDLSLKFKDTILLSYTYGSLGAVFQNMLVFDSALFYNTKQIKLLGEKGDKDELAIAYGNLGIIYKAKKDYANSKANYLKALEIFKKSKSTRLMTISYINLAELCILTKNGKQAIEYYDKAQKETAESGEREIIAATHLGKYEAYYSMKDYKNSIDEYMKYRAIHDSLLKEESMTEVVRLESKYEMGKKQKENELLKAQDKIKQTLIDVSKENERKTKLFLYSSLAVLIIIMVLAVLLFFGLKENKLKTKIINEQKNLVKEKNKDITDSINYAKRIQEALLPAKELKYEIFPNAFVFFKPRDIVSGDFYWFTKKNGKRIITAVDCTGHGVPGAFMSMIGNTFLTEIIEGKGITQPADILSEMRYLVIKSLKQTHDMTESKDGMDMALLAFDDETNTVEYSGANNPLWLIRNGECIEYKPDKRPIGYFRGEGRPFTNHKIELQKGDTIYIFTDGYADQFGGKNGKKLKYKPFKETLLSIQHEPMLKQEEILLEKFNEWKGILGQIDDVLIIGIRI